MLKNINLQTDTIISLGLIFVLIVSVFTGGSQELQMTISVGLIGHMGKIVSALHDAKVNKDNKSTKDYENTTKEE